MIAFTDVHYTPSGGATAACVLAGDWSDEAPAEETWAMIEAVAPYIPGAFWRRELPCLRAVLDPLVSRIELIVVDGYVWLGPDRPGLGARLFDELGGSIPVVGVAKTAFAGSGATEVLRGSAIRPLFVTAAGMDTADAARRVREMHGPHRLPTLLKRVDTLARTSAPA